MADPDPHAAPTTAETSAEVGHQENVFPPFDTHNFVPQLVWLVIVFGILYYVMSRVALPRVGGILEARRARIEGDLGDAARMQEAATAASAAYDQKLADAKARAQALAQETHDRLHAETEARRKELESALNAKLAAAEAQIQDTKSRAMASVGDIARDAASTIIQHLTGKPADPAAVAAAVNASQRT